MTMKSKFIQHLKKTYPDLQSTELDPLVSENLLSPFVLELPKSVLEQAQKSVSALFRLRENPEYKKAYAAEIEARGLKDPGNKSICMSYDFHVTADNGIKLIEVNTNASFLALGLEMYAMNEIPLPVPDFSKNEIRENIETELKLQGKSVASSMNLAIIDEKPEQQRLYVEFLVYNEMFKHWGWMPAIRDFRDLSPKDFDFIYNRHTDFYLESPESAPLKEAFLNRTTCLSPNPYEYCLLADKQRMIDWHQDDVLNQWNVPQDDQRQIRATVPVSLDVTFDRQEEIWSRRKSFFFKPKRAFGAKQSYRGSSITHKAYDGIVGQEFIAQEFVAPTEATFTKPQGAEPPGPITFKYDLRCYAYQGRLQLVVARLYQGQVTNLKTPLGGFACVRFV